MTVPRTPEQLAEAVSLLQFVTEAVADEWPRRFPNSGETGRRMAASPAALAALLSRLQAAERERDEAREQVNHGLSLTLAWIERKYGTIPDNAPSLHELIAGAEAAEARVKELDAALSGEDS